LSAKPHASIPIGVVVERRKAASTWLDHVWRTVAVLGGRPDAAPWTALTTAEGVATFYAGAAEIALFRTEAGNYRSNLASAEPSIWVALRRTGGEPPYDLFAVTADPAEGESYTQAGDALVDAVPMPETVRQIIEAFVADHHVEQPVYRRKRDGADRERAARRGPVGKERRA
jgi:hypothetical protein